MKYINRDLKGTFGYIRKQLVFEIVKTAVLFVMAFGIFFIGYLTLGTKKSLWSILAVLALLPACKSLVGVIMLARFRSLAEDKYRLYSESTAGIGTLYENVLTTGDKTYYVPVLCAASGSLIAYYPGDQQDTNKLKEHLTSTLNKAGHNITVKIYNDEGSFCERAAQMAAKSADNDSAKISGVFNTIKAVSL